MSSKRCAVVLALCIASAGAARGGGPDAALFYPGTNAFAIPSIEVERQRALADLAAGAPGLAAERLAALIARSGDVPLLHAHLAEARARMGEISTVGPHLEAARGLGPELFRGLLGRPAFAGLPGDEVARLLAGLEAPAPAKPIVPAEAIDGVIRVEDGAVVWQREANRLLVRTVFADVPTRPVVAAETPGRPELRLLRQWAAEGTAAGNHSDLYDNRDRDHARTDLSILPQVTRVLYGEEARAAGVDFGPNVDLTFDTIVVGNSSTAQTAGPLWRSQPRQLYTDPRGIAALAALYGQNHLYVYPEHRDHDPERGDLMTANTPYLVVSQGSSRSDKAFVDALMLVLAALRPETKAFLQEGGLIAPTLQMILRRGMRGSYGREAYLSGRAHPAALDGANIGLTDMLRLARRLTPETVPPVVQLDLTSAPVRLRPGVDVMLGTGGERLFETGSAIAIAWRGLAGTRRYRLSAARTENPGDRSLTFHWRLLRGDPARVRLAPSGATLDLEVDWGAATVERRDQLPGDRVDIAVFADNGAELSAPAILSLLFPGNQRRAYDSASRVLSVDYTAPPPRGYVDPLVFPARDWTDVYSYDAAELIGWTRQRDGAETHFTPEGHRVVARDDLGRPVRAMQVHYPVRTGPDGVPHIVEEETGLVIGYAYADEEDRRGVARPLAR
ncbi:MAG: hypothetical protein AAGE18_02370 [Pseudomonadota bacterium]